MKRLFIAATFLFTVISCESEDPQTCWDCSFGIVQGYQKPDTTFCKEGNDPGEFFTPDGQPIQSFCTKR